MSAMEKFTTAPWVMGTAEEHKESVIQSELLTQVFRGPVHQMKRSFSTGLTITGFTCSFASCILAG